MQYIKSIVSIFSDILHTIWNYELVNIAGNNVKTSNIALAILLLLAGIKYFGHFSQHLRNYLKNRIPKDKDTVNSLERLGTYIAGTLFCILVMQVANIPLSIFAFIGGALAIGIGFGAQTLMSNFISSLIIMLEKPIKIGDIVEIEGITGTVSSIGARCTTLVTFANIEALIPNSKLVQTTLINWTLSGHKIKIQAEITFPRSHAKVIDPKLLISQISTVIDKLKLSTIKSTQSTSEVFLTKVNVDHFVLLLNLYCDTAKIDNFAETQNALNMALLEELKDYHFNIEYLKAIKVKQEPSTHT